MIKVINNIERAIIITSILLYPIIFLTDFSNLFDTPKLTLILVSSLLLLLIKSIKVFWNKSIDINIGKHDLAVLLFIVAAGLSAILVSPNKSDVLYIPGSLSFVILSGFYYYCINQFEKRSDFLNAFLISSFILALTQIFSFFGINKLFTFLPDFAKDTVFTPFGNIINTILILTSSLPILIYRALNNKDVSEKILSALVIVIIILGIGTSTKMILSNNDNPIFVLSYKNSWSIAADSLKSNPITGVGLSNFGYAFEKFKPVQFNLQKDWNIKYIQGSSFGMTALAENGLAGLAAILFLLFIILKNNNWKKPHHLSVLIVFVGMLLLPASITLLPLFFVLLSISTETKKVNLLKTESKTISLLPSISSAILVALIIYLYAKPLYADILFTKSTEDLNEGKVSSAYENINKATKINPYVDKYHLLSSALNLAIAENIAKKQDITEDDKNNISKLVQQAIRESKAAVSVNTTKSSNWESLSNTYKTISVFAKGAETFAIESINQAISLDPINPLLRIKLANLYYSQKKYDLAIEALKLAVLAKPDLPNAHYNLAIVYKEAKQLDKAKEEMNITLSLLGKNSTDYEKALKELQDIEELTKPEQSAKPIIDPQIELQPENPEG